MSNEKNRLLEVGDVLYNADENSGNSWNNTPSRKIKIARVTKTQAIGECGTKVKRVTGGWGYSEIGKYGSFHFGTEIAEERYQERIAKMKLQAERDKLGRAMPYIKWSSLTLDQLRRIKAIIDETNTNN